MAIHAAADGGYMLSALYAAGIGWYGDRLRRDRIAPPEARLRQREHDQSCQDKHCEQRHADAHKPATRRSHLDNSGLILTTVEVKPCRLGCTLREKFLQHHRGVRAPCNAD